MNPPDSSFSTGMQPGANEKEFEDFRDFHGSNLTQLYYGQPLFSQSQQNIHGHDHMASFIPGINCCESIDMNGAITHFHSQPSFFHSQQSNGGQDYLTPSFIPGCNYLELMNMNGAATHFQAQPSNPQSHQDTESQGHLTASLVPGFDHLKPMNMNGSVPSFPQSYPNSKQATESDDYLTSLLTDCDNPLNSRGRECAVGNLVSNFSDLPAVGYPSRPSMNPLEPLFTATYPETWLPTAFAPNQLMGAGTMSDGSCATRQTAFSSNNLCYSNPFETQSLLVPSVIEGSEPPLINIDPPPHLWSRGKSNVDNGLEMDVMPFSKRQDAVLRGHKSTSLQPSNSGTNQSFSFASHFSEEHSTHPISWLWNRDNYCVIPKICSLGLDPRSMSTAPPRHEGNSHEIASQYLSSHTQGVFK